MSYNSPVAILSKFEKDYSVAHGTKLLSGVQIGVLQDEVVVLLEEKLRLRQKANAVQKDDGKEEGILIVNVDSVTESSKQEEIVSEETPSYREEDDIVIPQNESITSQDISPIDLGKYFGREGRRNFFNRYHVISDEISKVQFDSRAKTASLPEFNPNSELVFEDPSEKDGTAYESIYPLTECKSSMTTPFRNRKKPSLLEDDSDRQEVMTGSRNSLFSSNNDIVPAAPSSPIPTNINGKNRRTKPTMDKHSNSNSVSSLHLGNGVASPPLEKVTVNSCKDCMNNHDNYLKLKELLRSPTRPSTTIANMNSEFIMRPTTPRSTYLEGCVREKLSPRPIIVRKAVTRKFSLSRQGKLN